MQCLCVRATRQREDGFAVAARSAWDHLPHHEATPEVVVRDITGARQSEQALGADPRIDCEFKLEDTLGLCGLCVQPNMPANTAAQRYS